MKVDPKPRLRSKMMSLTSTRKRDRPRRRTQETDTETVIEATTTETETKRVETTTITVEIKSIFRRERLMDKTSTRRKIPEDLTCRRQRAKTTETIEMTVMEIATRSTMKREISNTSLMKS